VGDGVTVAVAVAVGEVVSVAVGDAVVSVVAVGAGVAVGDDDAAWVADAVGVGVGVGEPEQNTQIAAEPMSGATLSCTAATARTSPARVRER
jgi:hypothetical protein